MDFNELREPIRNSFCTFFKALRDWLFESVFLEPEGIGALACLAGVAVLFALAYGLITVSYDLMPDPDGTNVAARLAALSIAPERWI